jgi:hypothetical protein
VHRCVDCYLFKTREVRKKDTSWLRHNFGRAKKALNHIKQCGKARVFWCYFRNTKTSYYVDMSIPAKLRSLGKRHMWEPYPLISRMKGCRSFEGGV